MHLTPLRGLRIAALCLAVAPSPSPAQAHAHAHAHRGGGPAVLILEDGRVGRYEVSVWSKPDIGAAMLSIVLRATDGAAFVQPSTVRVAVAPVSGRRRETSYDAHAMRVRRGARYVAMVPLDSAEPWRVRVTVVGPAGSGDVLAEVEALPASPIGPIGLGVYSFPFVLTALLWWRVAVVRRRMTREVANANGMGHIHASNFQTHA